MDKSIIYAQLEPGWWLRQSSLWNTDYYSADILFDTAHLIDNVYTSSAPIQNNGLNDEPSNISPSLLIDGLRTAAAQRLFDMHCTRIKGNANLSSVFNSQA